MKKTKLLTSLAFSAMALTGAAQTDSAGLGATEFEIYGFAMMDMGYNTGQIDPAWYDAARPTKLPDSKNQFNGDGRTYLSVRQTRFGVKSTTATKMGELKTVFDMDMFGVGPDAGVTTIRLRHAYGELGHFGAGQTESAFMDLDVFPNTLEYWGPCGMLFFRNVQFRWIPIKGATHLVFSLENPGASADLGANTDRVEVTGTSAKFPMPDIAGHYRQAGNWGYVQLGGIVRYFEWNDPNKNANLDLSGSAVGYGASLSSNLNIGKSDVVRLQGVYGAGIQNYFNDAPVDVGTKANPNNPTKPIVGVALPVLGLTAFLDHQWNEKFSSSIGYSSTEITNSDGQNPNAFHKGQYVAANILYYPVKNVMMGFEALYFDRANYKDGFTSSNTRLNFSFKYNFSTKFKS